MQDVVQQAARAALGHGVPKSIQVSIDSARKIIKLIGPPGSGKSRIAREIPNRLTTAQRQQWRCMTGHFDDPKAMELEWEPRR
jgi:ABC-type phosphate transport system ATPase subunit